MLSYLRAPHHQHRWIFHQLDLHRYHFVVTFRLKTLENQTMGIEPLSFLSL